MALKFTLALASLAFSAAAVAAPPPDSITVPVTLQADDTDPTISYADIAVRKANPNQTFNDYYTFHLDGLSDVSFSVVSNPLMNAAGNVLLKAVNFDLIKLAGPNDFQGTGSLSADGLHAYFGYTGLVAGDYTVTLLGHAVGNAGGSYYGDMSVTGAVPEPETVGLALAGLAVIAGLSRRRKAD